MDRRTDWAATTHYPNTHTHSTKTPPQPPPTTHNRNFPPRVAYEQLLLARENDNNNNGPGPARRKGIKRAPTFDPSVLQVALERVRRRMG